MICPVCQTEAEVSGGLCSNCGQTVATPRTLGPGSVIASRYEIKSALGAGGMGMVYRANDRALSEEVAIKVLRAGALDLDMARRFRSEIKLAWKVRHRNVCGIHEYGEDGDLLFISMELVEGVDLKRFLRQRGALPWEEAYDICLQTAEGLEAIHEAGVIHRDLKTANIMRDVKGRVRLMDFGIAKVFGPEIQTSITATGAVVGSPEYMSPEQVRGQRLDFRSDLYSLGLVVFEVFTGRIPFPAETPLAAMLKSLEEPPPLEGPEAARIPDALVSVLRRALAKQRVDRYPTCRDMTAAISEARDALKNQLTGANSAVPPAVDAEEDAPTVGLDEWARSQLARSSPRPSATAPPATPPTQARLLVSPLMRALKHADPELRARAIEALARMGGDAKAAIPALVTALNDETEPRVRARLAETLRAMGHTGEASPPASETDLRINAALAAFPTSPPVAVRPEVPPGRVEPTEAPAVAPPKHPSTEPRSSFDGFLASLPALEERKSRRFPTYAAVAVVPVLALAYYWSAARKPGREPPSPPPTSLAAESPAPPPAVIDDPKPASPETALAAARVKELEQKLAAMEADKSAVAAKAAREARTRLETQTAAAGRSPDPLALRQAEDQARKAAEAEQARETAAERARLEEERQAAAEKARLAEPKPSDEPKPAEPVASAPVSSPPLSSIRPGDLVKLGDPGVVPPVLAQRPTLEYPSIAARLEIQGVVQLRILIDENAAITDVQVVSGRRELVDGAIKNVRRWKYSCATKDGVPVKIWIPVSVTFTLR